MKRCFFLSTFFLLAFGAKAQDSSSPLSADRPGFGVSTNTLQTGSIQFETGVYYRYFKLQRSNWPYPSYWNMLDNVTAMRVGVQDWLEVKAELQFGYGLDGVVVPEGDFYLAPFVVGARVRLFNHPTLGRGLVYGSINFPGFATLDESQPRTLDLRMLYTLAPLDDVEVDLNVGFFTFPDSPIPSHGIYAVSARWAVSIQDQLFLEYFGSTEFNNANGWLTVGDINHISSTMAVDISVGYEIHHPADPEGFEKRILFSLGLAARLSESRKD